MRRARPVSFRPPRPRAMPWRAAALWTVVALVSIVGRTAAQSPELVDRIVAIVDEEAILLSDLDREVESYRFEATQTGQEITQDDAAIRNNMLQRLIDVKLLVAQAKLDGVDISEEEVEQAVARSLGEVIERFGTRSALEQELARNGMTYADLEARNRDLIRNRLYTSRMISTHIRPKVEVREDEIRQFYEDHKDEIPTMPATVGLSNILVVPQPDEDAQSGLDTKLASIEEALDDGRRFSDVAREFSEGPNAGNGGSVGSFAKGDFFHPVLEEVAWSQPVRVPSEAITTEIGVFIIQVDERNDDQVTISQILLRVEIGQEDWDVAEARANEAYSLATQGQDFAELVEKYSDDPTSKAEGGKLGEFPADRLSGVFKDAIQGLAIGEVAAPVKGSAGFFVLRVDSMSDPETLSYDDVHDQLRAAVEDQKIDAELQVFLGELRERFYVDIKA